MNDDDALLPLALDADLRAAIDDALAPQPVAAEVAARIKRRLLDRIAVDAGLQVAVPAQAGTWRPFVPGVEIKVLHKSGETLSYLLRMAPGSELPNHRHPHDEECVVVEGVVEMGGLTLGPGGYLMERAGTLHAPLRTAAGAIIFLRGATPRAEHLV
ncbi:MAG TPA: cupin domain-containing protein [Albitalea sp.]|uniref:cupin domain-containing protein n=1 Tax=Piscinibacter sp. TaxID=1903157 RepID=UPI002ED50F4D